MNTKSPVVQAGPNLHTCYTISLSRTNLEILYTDWVRNMNIQGRSRNSLSSYNKIYIHGTDDKYKKTKIFLKRTKSDYGIQYTHPHSVGVVCGCVRTLMLNITDHVRANLGKTHFKLKTTKEKE